MKNRGTMSRIKIYQRFYRGKREREGETRGL
jgi:hypothetical protein